MAKYFNKIKEIWQNRRYRSIIILFFILYFSFVFSLINASKSTEVKLTGLEAFKVKTNYSYTIEYLGNYYNLNNMPDELKKYNIENYNPKNIYNLIKNATLESTNYIENSNTYIISETSVNKIIYNDDLEINNNIKIITYLSNDNVIKVKIDFIDYSLSLEVK